MPALEGWEASLADAIAVIARPGERARARLGRVAKADGEHCVFLKTKRTRLKRPSGTSWT